MLVRGALPGTAQQRWFVFPVDHPNAARLVGEGIPQDARLTWASPARPRPYLSRVSITPPAGAIPLRASYQLDVSGTSADGKHFTAPFVRWHSGDSTIATVDTAGVISPLREGRVRMIASAGGWQADTLEIEVAKGTFTPVLKESWRQGLEANWIPWGTPRPRVDPDSEASGVLWTRGDSSYDSGVYTRSGIPAVNGLGLEAAVSGVLSAQQWQRHSLGLYADMDSTWLARWDHRTGGLDAPNPDPDLRCWLAYPAAEGAKGDEQVGFGCGRAPQSAPVPPPLGDGAWHLMRLQLFPDGRLGVAIDGVPVGITAVPARLDHPFRAVISGQSHRTRMLVGEVNIWTGVRDDIDWRVLR
jgi:hypothetical protein